MFEDQPQSEIDARRARDPEFRALHDQHRKLNKKCMDAELGVLPIDDVTLGRMKREAAGQATSSANVRNSAPNDVPTL